MAVTAARRSARYLPSQKGGDTHEIEDQYYRWIGAGSCNHGNGTGACQRFRLYRAGLDGDSSTVYNNKWIGSGITAVFRHQPEAGEVAKSFFL
jgi:hypothetical protein